MNAELMQNGVATQNVSAPKIELRKLKLCEFMSEETQCYSAEVWVDGVLAFTASNEGHGGCDRYDPPFDKAKQTFGHDAMKAGMDKLEAYCATLPPMPAAKWEGAKPLEYDVELLMHKLIEDQRQAKEVEKIMKKLRECATFVQNGEIRTYKKVLPALMSQQLAFAKPRHPGAVWLNELPAEEARALIKQHLFK